MVALLGPGSVKAASAARFEGDWISTDGSLFRFSFCTPTAIMALVFILGAARLAAAIPHEGDWIDPDNLTIRGIRRFVLY